MYIGCLPIVCGEARIAGPIHLQKRYDHFRFRMVKRVGVDILIHILYSTYYNSHTQRTEHLVVG